MLTSSFCEGTFMLPLPRQLSPIWSSTCWNQTPDSASEWNSFLLCHQWESVRESRSSHCRLHLRRRWQWFFVFPLIDFRTSLLPVSSWTGLFLSHSQTLFLLTVPEIIMPPGSCVFSPFLLCVLVLGYFILFSELTLAYVVVCQGNSFCFHLSPQCLPPISSCQLLNLPRKHLCLKLSKTELITIPSPTCYSSRVHSLIPNVSTENPKVIV